MKPFIQLRPDWAVAVHGKKDRVIISSKRNKCRDRALFIYLALLQPAADYQDSGIVGSGPVARLSFTPPLQRGALRVAPDGKPFKRFSIFRAVGTPG
jgi:hypothetical protein